MEQGAAAACCVLPYDEFWLPHWNMEPSSAWAPPGLPAATPLVFGSCLQTPAISNGGQVVECAAAIQNYETEEAALESVVDHDLDNNDVEVKIDGMFEETASMFEARIDIMEKKMHRYPAIIKDLGDWFTVPRVVAIGPYHHGQEHLEPAERLKHLAARHCVKESRRTVQEMYDAVVSAAYSCDARELYDNKDIDEGLFDDDNFLPMMFYDACFLVQFMLLNTEGSAKMDPLFASLLSSDADDIFHDIMLLENQIPWQVVMAVMELGTLDLQDFVSNLKGCLQDRKEYNEPVALQHSYEPPHLLGLLRYYIVGRSDDDKEEEEEDKEEEDDDDDSEKHKTDESISYSISAIELAKIGIRLKANKTTELIRMGINKKGPFFGELFLAPVTLTRVRASYLVNMAALELCSTLDFSGQHEQSAVCSYLLLFTMFVDREEDVHELRTKGLLQGGSGLTDSEVLTFLTNLQSLRLGGRYVEIMEHIQLYRNSRRMRTKIHTIYYNNKKTIITVCSVVGGVISILGTLKSLQGSH